MQYISLAAIYLILAAVVGTVFIRSLSLRDGSGKLISVLLLFSGLDLAAYAMQQVTGSVIVCEWTVSIEYVLMMWYMVMLFTIKYYLDRKNVASIDRIARLFIYALSAVATVLLLSTPSIGFMFRCEMMDTGSGYSVPVIIYNGGFYYMYIVWLAVMNMYTLVTIATQIKNRSIVDREKYAVITAAVAAPTVSEAIYILTGSVGANFDPVVMGISGVVLFFAFGSIGRYIARIYSRDLMVDDIGSVVVLFDDTGRLADYSEQAGQFMDFSEDYLDIMDEDLFLEGRLNLDMEDLHDGDTAEISMNVGDEVHFYNMDFRELRDSSGYVIGHVYLFNDITDLRNIYSEFENEITKDPVTGLYSERVLNIRLQEMDSQENMPLCIAVMDINGLGMVNDMFGMDEGDRMIRYCNDILHSQMRLEDFAATVDSETVVLMPHFPEKMAVEKMRLVKDMISYQVDFPITVSVEFGVAEKRDDSMMIEDVLKAARASMRYKKLLDPDSSRAFVVNTLTAYEDQLGINSPDRRARVREDVRCIAERLGLSDEVKAKGELAAMLQSIGLITVSDRIINKKGELDEEEWEDIRRHPLKGYYILNSNPELEGVATYVLAQNERWDGTGYPNGLAGEEIPLLSRIISVADTYELMTHDTKYRAARTESEAMDELVSCSGTQFDANVVRVYLNILRERQARN